MATYILAETAKTLHRPFSIQALYRGYNSVCMCTRELRERERGRGREREKFAAMANSAVLKLACTAVLVCLLVTAQADATVTCSQVTQLLNPCVNYLIYGGAVPSACCAGVKQVKAASSTGEDRRTACSCIQDGAAMIPGIDYNLVASLPSQCGVSLPYKISPSTDCSRIN